MLCSNCSENLKPVVVWDIDGTIGDYHGAFTEFVGRYWSKQVYGVPPWDGEGDFEDYLGLTREQYRQAKLAYRLGGNKRWLPIYDGAKVAMEASVLAGAELWITTTRPWQRLDNIDPDTQYWLQRHELPYDHMIYDEDKLHMICQQVDPARIVAVIDDLPEQYDRAVELGLPVIQRGNHHNAGLSVSRPNRGDLGRVGAWARQQTIEWRSSGDDGSLLKL